MKQLIPTLILYLISTSALAQHSYRQLFDGSDTGEFSVKVNIDAAVISPWKIGAPQKTIFSAPRTEPNALVTELGASYPPDQQASVSLNVDSFKTWNSGIVAVQWTQKIDFEQGSDGGIIEYSIDSGQTWQNAHESPAVYNFYGFPTSTVDTLPSGKVGFTGTDTNWRNIWLCYDASFSFYHNIQIRFTLESDSVESNQEGWIIDNIYMDETIFHTVGELEQKEYLKIFPNPSSGRIHIQAKRLDEFHIIEQLQVLDLQGRVVQEHQMVPIKYWIDLSDEPEGVYFLKVKTNLKQETIKVIHSAQ